MNFIEREFELYNKETQEFLKMIKLYIKSPVEDNGADWSCTFGIEGNKELFEQKIFGIDSFQALQGAINIAKIEVEKFRKEYKVTFLEGKDLWL